MNEKIAKRNIKFTGCASSYPELTCTGADDFTRGCEAVFLTPLDDIAPVDPGATRRTRDDWGGYAMASLFLEARLRELFFVHRSPTPR